MARTIKLHVQCDRLPDSGDGRQIGARLSAAVARDDADRAQSEDLSRLLPWRWGDGNGRAWDPAKAEAWQVYAVENQVARPIYNAAPVPLQTLQGDDRLITEINARADAFAQATFEPSRLELPQGELTGHTLFALVESLTTLPHPYPVTLKIWSCLALPSDQADSRELLALPVFSFGGEAHVFAPDLADGTPLDPVRDEAGQQIRGAWRVPYLQDGAGNAPGLVVEVRSAPPPPTSMRSQIALPADFTVLRSTPRQGLGGAVDDWTVAADEDWIAALPDRIAEALDPVPRFLSALDTVIHHAIADPEHPDQAKAVLRLLKDPDQRELLLRLLDTVGWRILSPATVAAPLVAPPAALLPLLVSGGATEARAARDAAQAIFVALSDRDAIAGGADGRPRNAAPPQFRLRSRRSFALSIGLTHEESAGDAAADKAWPPVEAEAEFRAWLFQHWLSQDMSRQPRPLPQGAGREIAVAHELELGTGETLSFVSRSIPQLDFGQLSGPLDIPLRAQLADVAAASELTIGVRVFNVIDTTGSPLADLRVRIRVEAGQLTVNGEAPTQVDPAQPFVVLLRFLSNEDVLQVSASAGQGNLSTDLIVIGEFSAVLGRGALWVESTLGAFADVSAQMTDQTIGFLQAYREGPVPTSGLRLAIARAFAGPYLPRLLAGELPGVALDANPRTRIAAAFEALIPRLYDNLKAGALRALRDAGEDPARVEPLFEMVAQRASADARARSATLVPIAACGERLTPRAAPIILPIDQLQPFPRNEDLWERFAGAGALIGRSASPTTDYPDDDLWWSLNAADLHVVAAGTRRGPLDERNWVRRVDPVPMQIAEIGGVRAARIAYDSRSIIGEMSSDVRHRENSAANGPRRPEAYGFPRQLQVGSGRLDPGTLPPLSAGKSFFVFPYLIGHGGALPVLLRRDPADPVQPRWPGQGRSFALAKELFTDAGLFDRIRKVACRRTTAVSTPRLDEGASTKLGVPEGVIPLAGELPIVPAPVTLPAGEEARFYLDREGLGGSLAFAVADPSRRAMQVDLAGGGLASGETLTITVRGTVTGGQQPLAVLCVVNLEHRHWPSGNAGLRLTIGQKGVGIFLEQPRDGFMPDEPSTFSFLGVGDDPAVAASHWESFAVTLTPSVELETAPPTVAIGSGQSEDFRILDGVPQLAPEVAHQKRMVAVLDGIGPGHPTPARLRIRRPATDFGTYAQWINWSLPNATKDRLNGEHRHQTKERAQSDREDTTIDDPAVSALALELVEIFPSRMQRGFRIIRASRRESLASLIDPRPRGTDVTVSVSASAAVSSDGSEVTVAKGRIYELRLYGIVPERQDEIASGVICLNRISAPVRHALRSMTDDGQPYRLGAPLTFTLEVATDEMPPLEEAHRCLVALAERRGSGMREDDAMQVRLDWQRLASATEMDQAETYRLFRYVDRVALFSQRWSWRGRPHPAGPFFEGSKPSATMSQILFNGRRDDDVGIILERRLERSHLTRLPLDQRPPLIVKDLQYRGGAHWWRFGLRATSRYSALRPSSGAMIRFTHRDRARAEARWQDWIVRDRPTGRVPKRPPLSIVLPLTEPYMSDHSVPPLLALFAEPMFANFHLGDGLEAAVDYVRHPLIEAKGGPKQRYWPQVGPDPVLTARGHTGQAAPLRLDGPLGYTFDRETEAPRFNHSGYLVSLVGGQDAGAEPWAMVKVRFRRLEAPELSNVLPAKAEPEVGYLIASAHEVAPVTTGALRTLGTVHEGIALEVGTIDQPGTMTLSVALPDHSLQGGPSLELHWDVGDGKFSIASSTNLGGTGAWTAPIASGSRVRLRLVIAERDHPTEGQQPYKPVLDVSVRVYVTREDEGLIRDHENAWITLACLPLDAGYAVVPGTPVGVHYAGARGHELSVLPVRLSGFTPAIWCQFAQPFSSIRVRVARRREIHTVPHDALRAGVNADWRPAFSWIDAAGETHAIEEVLPLVQTDAESQVEFAMVIVLTRYIHDAFDRLRETPMRVFDPALSENPVWTAPEDLSAPEPGSSGRIRFLTIQRLARTVAAPGATSFPEAFFEEDLSEQVEMDPQDAVGRVLGTSKPIEWSTPPR